MKTTIKKVCSLMLIFLMAMLCLNVQAQPTVDLRSVVKDDLERSNADHTYIAVMDIRTGDIVNSGHFFKGSAQDNWLQKPISTGLLSTIAVSAALETNKITLEDTVDTGDGVLEYRGDTIYDHNWRRGGYGDLTLRQALKMLSNVGVMKAVSKAYVNVDDFVNDFRKKTDLQITDFNFTKCKATPTQICKLYSRIASEGDSTAVDVLKCTSDEKGLLRYNLYDVKDVLVNGSVISDKSGKTVEICGFLPASSPQYTIYVRLEKANSQFSISMARDIFYDVCKTYLHKCNQ